LSDYLNDEIESNQPGRSQSRTLGIFKNERHLLSLNRRIKTKQFINLLMIIPALFYKKSRLLPDFFD
jgi:hypothetical protein